MTCKWKWLAWLAMLVATQAPAAPGAHDVAGTWALVSSVTERDGVRTEQFGAGAQGRLVLDPEGHFMLTIIGAGLPKFASGNRAAGTPEETQAVMSRSIAMLGDYAVDEAAGTLTFRVVASTFPNWDGTQQKRLLAPIEGDVLTYTTPTASSGGVGTVTWRRLR